MFLYFELSNRKRKTILSFTDGMAKNISLCNKNETPFHPHGLGSDKMKKIINIQSYEKKYVAQERIGLPTLWGNVIKLGKVINKYANEKDSGGKRHHYPTSLCRKKLPCFHKQGRGFKLNLNIQRLGMQHKRKIANN